MITVVAASDPVIRLAAETTDKGWLLGLTTLFFLLSFVGWAVWAYHPALRSSWEACGRIPLEDEDDRRVGGDA